MPRKQRTAHRARAGILGPSADPAFMSLATPAIRTRVRIAHWVHQGKHAIQHHIGRPVGRVILQRWMRDTRDRHIIETLGLPRHIVTEVLGEHGTTLHVDPRKLIRIVAHAPRHVERRPSSMAFIWDGNWDLRREDLRVGSRYRLISELDEFRDRLEETQTYRNLVARMDSGKPWASHQMGVVLDTPEKILEYLRVYLAFLDDMAINGFDASRGKDPLGVAISRDGKILKVNRGLHRLAMAQRIGLPEIPVRVLHVHRLWWNAVVQDATGMVALERLQQALQSCVPEECAGPLDEETELALPAGFWPPSRAGKSGTPAGDGKPS